MLNEYAKVATEKEHGRIIHMELMDNGTLQTSLLARDVLGWSFGYEELVVEALDMDVRSRRFH